MNMYTGGKIPGSEGQSAWKLENVEPWACFTHSLVINELVLYVYV